MRGQPSIVMTLVIGFLYPFVILLGVYVIINGRLTPGGGFQGGAIMAWLFIGRYLLHPIEDLSTEALHLIERGFLAFILLMPILLLFSGFVNENPQYRTLYLILMDTLIGGEVGFGLAVVVFRFAFFRGVGESWHF